MFGVRCPWFLGRAYCPESLNGLDPSFLVLLLVLVLDIQRVLGTSTMRRTSRTPELSNSSI
jgi:hypothetical protein